MAASKKKSRKKAGRRRPGRGGGARAAVEPEGPASDSNEPGPEGWPMWPVSAGGADDAHAPLATGRMLVVMGEGEEAQAQALATLTQRAGLRHYAHTADFEASALDVDEADGADAMVFDELGIAVMHEVPDATDAVRASAAEVETAIEIVEPELYMFAAGWPFFPLEDGDGSPPTSPGAGGYLSGYRDAVNHLHDQLSGMPGLGLANAGAGVAAAQDCFRDTDATTWGLKAVGADVSSLSGRGVRVAVLDTGMDLRHPDYSGRAIQTRSFIPGETVQDGHGHGTHCIGSACGSLSPVSAPRYGVAYEAEIFAGKVLSNRGSGPDRGILAGINWAMRNDCRVVSMSLGAPAARSRAYDFVGRRALARGTLIVAATGNDSRRSQGVVRPVSRPANSDSILAVGAVDACQQVATFSNGSSSRRGGQVDLVAPGVDVLSSFRSPQTHRRLRGTSMATPHVAGVAALYAESGLGAGGGYELWARLAADARRLDASSRDVGGGMVQAP